MYSNTRYASRRKPQMSRPYRGRRSSGNSSRRGGRTKQDIHPSKFIKRAKQTDGTVAYVPKHSFDDFAIGDLLKRNLNERGYISPSPIQDQAIPVGLSGQDILGIANTGTGKTAAFALPVLHTLMQRPTSKALIIAPTRELAQQIEAECRIFAKDSGLFGTLLIGGAPMHRQTRDLQHRPTLIIGTPGRIKDHVERKTLDLSSVDTVVLDEVDRMVDMGFIGDIRYLLDLLAKPRQSYFFSATLDPKLRQLVDSLLTNPATISVTNGNTSDNVNQDVLYYQGTQHKLEVLQNTLLDENATRTLIFDETQRSVERLSKELVARGFKVNAIHGGKTQNQRTRALREFKQSEIDILVATDVAARGIDVADISHVINYTTPQSYDDYIHRIGRAGRVGRTGQAYTFIGS